MLGTIVYVDAHEDEDNYDTNVKWVAHLHVDYGGGDSRAYYALNTWLSNIGIYNAPDLMGKTVTADANGNITNIQ